jgi:hypothetical protein
MMFSCYRPNFPISAVNRTRNYTLSTMSDDEPRVGFRLTLAMPQHPNQRLASGASDYQRNNGGRT